MKHSFLLDRALFDLENFPATALCVRGEASGTVTDIGRELPRTQRAPRPASIKTGLPPKRAITGFQARSKDREILEEGGGPST